LSITRPSSATRIPGTALLLDQLIADVEASRVHQPIALKEGDEKEGVARRPAVLGRP